MTARRIASRAASLLLCLAALAPAASGAADATVAVRAAVRGRPVVGSNVVVTVRIQNARDVASVPFTLRFDPDILEFVAGAAVEGDFLRQDRNGTVFLAAQGAADGSPPDGMAAVVVGASRLGSSGASGGGTLCRLVFRAKTAGTTPLEFSRARVLDPSAASLPSRFTGATVVVREARR